MRSYIRLLACTSIMFISMGLIGAQHKPNKPAPAPPTTFSLPYSPSLVETNWTLLATHNIPLDNLGDGTLTFSWPVGQTFQQAGSVNYLYTDKISKKGVDIRTASQITAFGQVIAASEVTFNHDTESGNTCNPLVQPSHIQFILCSDGACSAYGTEFQRWFAGADRMQVAAGGWIMTAPLDPARWGSVLGKSGTYDSASAAGWEAVRTKLTNVGIVFGGGCFAGHGQYATGQAEFVLQGLTIQ